MQPDNANETALESWPRRVIGMYYDGFRTMVVGRTLWKLIIIKLVIMFGVLKLFFFPDYLHTNFESDAERAAHVLDTITHPAHGR